MRKPYRSDLTDAQWQLIQPLLPPAKPGGRPRIVDLREVVNTLFYQARTGCQWDYLPHDLVPKGTAWDYFTGWHQDGTATYVLVVSDPAVGAPAVTRALVAADADVLSISESHHSLEDVYLELIADDQEAESR